MTVAMSTVRSNVASPAASHSAAMASPPISDNMSATPARDASSWRSSSLPG